MKLIAILFAAILALCTAVYQPAETPLVEADVPSITTQQEQDKVLAVAEEPTPEMAAALPLPQECDSAPATDTASATAGTEETIVEAVPTDEKIELPVEVTPAIVEPAPIIEEPIIVESAKTDIPAVVEHAITGAPEDAPVIVEHAKTGYEGEDTTPTEPPVIKPEQPTQTADIATAIAAAEAFAIETYNVTIDPTLDFNNSAYRFPAAVPLTVDQDTLNYKAIDIVSYTFEQIMRRNDVTIEKIREAGIRCRVYIEQSENDLLVYCLYA